MLIISIMFSACSSGNTYYVYEQITNDKLEHISLINEDALIEKNKPLINNFSLSYFISKFSLIVISFYQDYLGKIKGSYCPMYPSCSVYGSEIIQKYGYKGVMMTFDRLNRCSHDLNDYKALVVDKKIKYYDPPVIY